jgi:lipopolysaccharide biosynthesis glycosyltransferase
MLIKFVPKCEKLFLCDTDLFFEFDIADLLEFNNENVHLMGHIDSCYYSRCFNIEPFKSFYELNKNNDRNYMNGGFLLINPKLFLKDGFYKKITQMKNKIYLMQNEQSALNFLPLKTKELPFYCNFFIYKTNKVNKQIFCGDYSAFKKENHKKIIHYISPKP